MSREPFYERSGRETRLLILVIAVSLGALVLLARLRFPGVEVRDVAPNPGPLAGLAARAAFDDMSAAITTLLGRVSTFVVPVTLDQIPEPLPARASGRGRAAPGGRPAEPPVVLPTLTRPVAGVRVRENLALVYVPTGWQVAPSDALSVVAVDAGRQVALVRTAGSNVGIDALPPAAFSGMDFVGAVDLLNGGANVHPVFVGRADRVADDKWSGDLLSIGSPQAVAPGALVFAINGRFIGLAIDRPDGIALVPAEMVQAAVTSLSGETATR